jgi:hypothetical protein
MGALRDRMVEEMKLRNFSPATQESYLYAETRLTKHYRRSPDQLDREQIRSYLLHLTVERKLSPNTMMGQIAGSRFFYNHTQPSVTLGYSNKLWVPPSVLWTCSTYLTDGLSDVARRRAGGSAKPQVRTGRHLP